MAADAKENMVTVTVRNLGTEDAPFVYFDGVLAFGIHQGVIQIELAANVLNVSGKDDLKNEVIVTAHLRCSLDAAQNLQREIGNALLIGMPAAPTLEGKTN
jgi:hypothetical protein